jgi:hypothetical protein
MTIRTLIRLRKGIIHVRDRNPRGAPRFIASSTSTTDTIDMPAGIAPNDIAVMVDFAVSPAVSVTPTNFTLIGTVLGATNRCIKSYKVLTGSETTITGMNGSTSNQKILLVFRNKPTSASFGVPTSVAEESTTNKPADQTIAIGTSSPSVAIALYCGTGGGATRGFTPAQDAEVIVAGSRLAARYLVSGAFGSSVVVTQTDDGANILSSFRLPAVK